MKITHYHHDSAMHSLAHTHIHTCKIHWAANNLLHGGLMRGGFFKQNFPPERFWFFSMASVLIWCRRAKLGLWKTLGSLWSLKSFCCRWWKKNRAWLLFWAEFSVDRGTVLVLKNDDRKIPAWVLQVSQPLTRPALIIRHILKPPLFS